MTLIDRIASASVMEGSPPHREARGALLDQDDERLYPPIAPVARLGVTPRGERARPPETIDADADRIVVRLDNMHGRALRGFVVRMGLSADEGDDAVQEVLLRLWSELRAGAIVEDPKAWSFRTIYRLAMDAHRWRRRVEALRDRLDGGAATRSVPGPEAGPNQSIWNLVDRLPPRQREILYLRYRADMTFEAAASVMGITSGAARANATKAMLALRRSVGSREEW
jgi:RNA polymerase sigma-70 factor (ECF subfamily)